MVGRVYRTKSVLCGSGEIKDSAKSGGIFNSILQSIDVRATKKTQNIVSIACLQFVFSLFAVFYRGSAVRLCSQARWLSTAEH
jgi:hypothetical protein